MEASKLPAEWVIDLDGISGISLVYNIRRRRVRSRTTSRELKRKSVYKTCGWVYKIFLSARLRNSSRRPPTSESDHSFIVEFTTHECTRMEENKMALVCKDRIGFSFFVRCLVCGLYVYFPAIIIFKVCQRFEIQNLRV